MVENMVVKKRQDNGFDGFHVPFVPRAPRSARRGVRKKKAEVNQICAFELLASLAGKLLQESESSSASSNASQTNDQLVISGDVVKTEQDENGPPKKELLDLGSCEESVFAPEIGDQKCILKRSPQVESDSIIEHSSAITNSDSSEKDSVDLCKKFPVSINSDTSAPILRHRSDVKLGIRDDDENYTRYKKPGTRPRAYWYPSRMGERRLRKLLTSKYWKVSPKLKENDLPRAYLEGKVKPFYRKRKISYGGETYEHESLYKRTCDGGFSSESVCNSPQKRTNINKTGSENGGSSSNEAHQASTRSEDSRVKLSIKSFKIPELFIEVPENATVGSLKRTVMETVTAILGNGLRVGVLLHGKKVRDDNRTLSQTGITCDENLDTLGFTLEPVSSANPPIPLSRDTSQLVLRSATAPVSSSGISEPLQDIPPLNTSITKAGSNNELLLSSPIDKTPSDSKALVSVDTLAVVPVNQKGRRSEIVQRRTRRPFSVTEVEALVEAVEQLGTGRWRDVKLRSFENADHRTYVDLKDKWKTLVHTAKIAPQQRRGEPVPQELLDRVLAAHAYWSQNQHCKNQAAVLKVIEGHVM